jgi:hypothetical protein
MCHTLKLLCPCLLCSECLVQKKVGRKYFSNSTHICYIFLRQYVIQASYKIQFLLSVTRYNTDVSYFSSYDSGTIKYVNGSGLYQVL